MRQQRSETDSILENIATAVIEHNKHVSIETQDPFDFYIQRVQSNFFADNEVFRTRFIKGYHVLINELKN